MDHTAQLGGGEIALRNLLRNLDPSCIDAQVVLCAEGPLVQQLRTHHPVHVIPIATSIRDVRKESIGWKSLSIWKNLLSGFAYTIRLSRFLRQLRPDFIHTNSLKSHVIGGLAGRLAKIPVIWHMRDRIAPDYLPPNAVRLVRLLSRVLPRFVIANSFATLSTVIDARAKGKCETRSHFRVVHDGCDVPTTRPMALEENVVKVGLIGRVSPWKGQDVFIRAAAAICEEFPQVRFQIIGAPLFSESVYESELKQLTRALQLDQRMEFTGFVHDVQSALERLQIVVHASTVGEPFGQVVIEAMAAGKPVIATNGGGIPEIVVDQVTGLLIEMNNTRALADAMAVLLRDPAKAQAMGAQGRKRVQELFTIERTTKGVEQVYRDLMSVSARGARQEEPTCTSVQLSGSEES